jgi:hypothetical protein
VHNEFINISMDVEQDGDDDDDGIIAVSLFIPLLITCISSSYSSQMKSPAPIRSVKTTKSKVKSTPPAATGVSTPPPGLEAGSKRLRNSGTLGKPSLQGKCY